MYPTATPSSFSSGWGLVAGFVVGLLGSGC
jgi:hypothetical protein